MRARTASAAVAVSVILLWPPAGSSLLSRAAGLQSADLHKLRSIADVQLSPDGARVAYSIQYSERMGRPYSQVWVRETNAGVPWRLGSDKDAASGPRWSPDGGWVAFFGREGEQGGLMVARPDGRDVRFLAPVLPTNHPLPSAGERLAWSPDGKQIAFISATPGPEADASGDPMVITRYLYKPTASEGSTRFNDNRRLHIFVADVASRKVRQLTDGHYYEHSIDWSPKGDEIVFVSNRGADPDRFFNYDLFAVRAADGVVRRLTDTKNAEYRPVWSPDGRTLAYLGTKRPLTSSETTMEDTHVWVMDAGTGDRHEMAGGIDNRQGGPGWAADGRSVLATVQERGETHLYRIPVDGGRADRVIGDRGSLGSWSTAAGDILAYAFSMPDRPSELYVKRPGAGAGRALTSLNAKVLEAKSIAPVEAFTFKSFDGTEIEAFLTKPVGIPSAAKAPLIVMIHGGPHGQQGPAFNSKAQIYASEGFASLMVNYRGSTGYGQALADKIFKDQNGGEARDVLEGVDAALARYAWLDRSRLGIEGGSYGGQLTDWIITQTDRFRAAIPAAGISNLVSFNYMAYYHDYLAVEFGAFPHENGLVDELWRRSALRYANRVKTPTMFIHGENDNDVPIAEAEQFYVALKDVGVETIMVRYPREGHGIRETNHVIDVIDRSLEWYRRHFANAGTASSR